MAYLRSVPAVKNATAKSVYRMPLPPAYGPPVGKVADVPRNDKLAYGRYLAGPLAHCVECHSAPTPRGPDLKNGLGAIEERARQVAADLSLVLQLSVRILPPAPAEAQPRPAERAARASASARPCARPCR